MTRPGRQEIEAAARVISGAHVDRAIFSGVLAAR